MTRHSKKYTPDGEDVLEFIQREQAALIRYLDMAFSQGKITETYYLFALSETCEATDWEGASEHFDTAYREFIDQSENYVKYRILERIEQGDAYLSTLNQMDPLYAKGMVLYEQLCEQLQQY